MRSKFTKAGLILAASLALITAGTASASAALPELKPTPTESSPVKFTGTGGTVGIEFETSGGLLTCEEMHIAGEFISAKETRNTVLTMKGCEGYTEIGVGYTLGGSERSNEVISVKLKGHLGYINKAKKEVGLMFGTEFKHEPGEKGPLWSEHVWACADSFCERGTNWTGQLIARVTPVDTFGKSLTVAATEAAEKQGLTKFEGGLVNQVVSFWGEQGGFEFSNTLSGFEQGGKGVEVKLEA
jgi:hypothetical protein